MNKTAFHLFVGLIILQQCNGCWSLRSAEGLSRGEVNLNYIAPLAGSARYGITDNIETRITLAGESIAYDAFFHTHDKIQPSNYGISLGINTFNYNHARYYHCGFVSSNRINNYFTPYTSILFLYSNDLNRIDYEISYYAIGVDIRIPVFKRLSILITPEIGHQMKYNSGGDIDTGGWLATGNVGVIYRIY